MLVIGPPPIAICVGPVRQHLNARRRGGLQAMRYFSKQRCETCRAYFLRLREPTPPNGRAVAGLRHAAPGGSYQPRACPLNGPTFVYGMVQASLASVWRDFGDPRPTPLA